LGLGFWVGRVNPRSQRGGCWIYALVQFEPGARGERGVLNREPVGEQYTNGGGGWGVRAVGSVGLECAYRIMWIPQGECTATFPSWISLTFFDVYSDEFFDCVDPMSRAGSSRGVQARS